MIWFGWFLLHINNCRLFNAQTSLYIHIKYIWFGLVGFYGISTIVGYLMTKPLYTYILNIYDLVWLVFMAYQQLFTGKFSLYIRGAYDKFPDFFRVGIKIIVDSWKFSMWLLYILWDDWLIFKSTATAAIGIHPTKAWLSQMVNFKSAIWHFRRTTCNKIVLNLEKMP